VSNCQFADEKEPQARLDRNFTSFNCTIPAASLKKEVIQNIKEVVDTIECGDLPSGSGMLEPCLLSPLRGIVFHPARFKTIYAFLPALLSLSLTFHVV
jgi:hypothetical protein